MEKLFSQVNKPFTIEFEDLKNDKSKAKLALESLKSHGFCWIKFTKDKFYQKIIPIVKTLYQYLTGPGKRTGSNKSLTGHISVEHKDVLRIITGDKVNEDSLPKEVECFR